MVRPRAKVTIEPIGSHIWDWEIDWYQNEWHWPLFRGRIKVTSTIALHLTLNISETVRDRGLVPKESRYEMTYGLSNGHVTDDVTWPWKVKLVTPIRLVRNISKTIWAAALYPECRAVAEITFPENGRGLSHVTPTIFGSTVSYPSDSLASCLTAAGVR